MSSIKLFKPIVKLHYPQTIVNASCIELPLYLIHLLHLQFACYSTWIIKHDLWMLDPLSKTRSCQPSIYSIAVLSSLINEFAHKILSTYYYCIKAYEMKWNLQLFPHVTHIIVIMSRTPSASTYTNFLVKYRFPSQCRVFLS